MTAQPEVKPSPRVLPHSLEAERAVLGGVLLHPKAFMQVADKVAASEFYHPAHEAIFGVMCDLDASRRPIDALTVGEALRDSGAISKLRSVNGEAYFAELTDSVVTVENIAFHAQMVRGKATIRRTIEAAHEIASRGYGDYGDVDDFRSWAEQKILKATGEAKGSALVSWGDAGAAAFERAAALAKAPAGTVSGVPSGFAGVDIRTHGFQPGDLVVIAARPSMGKTSLVMNAMQYAAQWRDVPSLVFSIEMGADGLADRGMSSLARVDLTQVRSASLDRAAWLELQKATFTMKRTPIKIDPSGKPSVAEICAVARRWRVTDTDPTKLGCIVVDHLGLIRDSGAFKERRDLEIGARTSALKALAKELHVPVIVLSQLSRDVEKRPDKRPMLSDLRDSGSIEQDADVVAFIYRDDYYDKASKSRGRAEVILAKVRQGQTGTVELGWSGATTTFFNIEDDQ